MKKLTATLMVIISTFFVTQVYAQTTYTIDTISEHSTEQDCWMVFENNVYDLTNYIQNHDRFMDIREWCGKDMTVDFKTKAGEGIDHRTSTYSLLENYLIGEVGEEVVKEETPEKVVEEDVVETKDVEEETKTVIKNPYNLLLPVLLTTIAYWGSYILVKKKVFTLTKFNAFWNTMLFLTLLIPSLGFGIFMMLRYQFTNLWDIDFDFMYWHVEISLVMGVLGINHLIQRLKVYLNQLTK